MAQRCQHETSADRLDDAGVFNVGKVELGFPCLHCYQTGYVTVPPDEVQGLFQRLSHLLDWEKDGDE